MPGRTTDDFGNRATMTRHTHVQLGRRGERIAWRFARRLGWRLLARNWTCPQGELDLVALDGATVVFAEVKSVGPASPAQPEDHVTAAKRRKIRCLAETFLRQYSLQQLPYRFDVLAVTVHPWPWRCPVVHYPEAF